MMGEDTEVIVARRRLVDALHAMHPDSRIMVSESLARELQEAWVEYDAAVLSAHLVNETDG